MVGRDSSDTGLASHSYGVPVPYAAAKGPVAIPAELGRRDSGPVGETGSEGCSGILDGPNRYQMEALGSGWCYTVEACHSSSRQKKIPHPLLMALVDSRSMLGPLYRIILSHVVGIGRNIAAFNAGSVETGLA